MIRQLLLPLVTVMAVMAAGCAPVLSAAQGSPVTFTATPAVDATAEASVLIANTGTEVMTAPAALLSAGGTSDPNCAARGTRYGCTLPDIAPGAGYRLYYSGTLRGLSLTFYTVSSGVRPIYLRYP